MEFIDKMYEKMKNYIYNTSEEELKEHYDWYEVDNKEDLLNEMFESYINSYNDDVLEEKINKLK